MNQAFTNKMKAEWAYPKTQVVKKNIFKVLNIEIDYIYFFVDCKNISVGLLPTIVRFLRMVIWHRKIN